MDTKKKVILDVDTGSDDAIAIMLAVLSGKLDVVGITVTQGNKPLPNCVENTLRVLDLMGVGDKIPVCPGCPAPMVRTLTPGRYANNPENQVQAHNKKGEPIDLHPAYLPAPPAHSKPQNMHACTFLVETIKQSKETITIIPVGPATNVGMAFRMDPTIADNVEEVVFMGGSVDKGNITPVGEANFVHDPEAVKIIIDSGVKCRIIGLNATHSAEFYREDADAYLAIGNAAGKLAHDLMYNRIEVGEALGWTQDGGDALHDALAVASVIDPTVITDLRQEPCDMDINGGAGDGQLIVDHRGGQDPNANTFVAYKADKKKFFQMIYDALKNQK